MRQIGTLPAQASAEKFTAYLITQGVAVQAEPDGEAWAIWVRDEDQVETAKQAFREFESRPDDPRYERVIREANSVLRQETQRREQTRRHLIDIRLRWQRPGKRRCPLTNAVLALCAMVFVLTGFGTERNSAALRMLGFRDTGRPLEVENDQIANRLVDISAGQVWRLVTPIFLHHDILHLVFNLLMFHVFASRIEDRLGTVRLGWLVLVIAVISNTAQGLAPSTWGTFSGGPFFVGISGVVYGLFGYMWIKTIYEPELGLIVSGSTVVLLVAWMFLGLFGLLDGSATQGPGQRGAGTVIANLAHVVGLFTGLALGSWTVIWRRLTAR